MQRWKSPFFQGLHTKGKKLHILHLPLSLYVSSYNPILSINDSDKPLEVIGFWGDTFRLKIEDIAKRFTTYRIQSNIYDGGTQIFFYPVPAEYGFSAISCDTQKESNEIENILNEEVNRVAFEFGENLILFRDGYHMKSDI